MSAGASQAPERSHAGIGVELYALEVAGVHSGG